ncbi:phosphatase PAP2 family protein [Hymenobacter busanensis]|uniref:Phosphatase PAP2 family protein n=1 Tax=Hymenobacter busanensis TaxID=2607656 RepID=A0A7L4ZY09_9BACT|nr:phosphatase PAP2 family protein [Hymenobacter busanensis]KAA9325840.1 phosphatase PAP2 family protein [Hymenobacter busanensis]QHJ06320.1 phosphatase PAP2 family protein [Hymenobacter busanensis]
MIDSLQNLDRWLLVTANNTATPALDRFMIFMSDRFVWFPAYLVIIVALIYYFGRRAYLLLPLLGLSVALADSVSSRFFKPYFARLRPCHDPELSETLNLVHGCGGKFGFISSHAANSFSMAVFLCLVLPRRFWPVKVLLLVWAAVLSYSRIYLAAHYPSDVLAGTTLGAALGWLCYWLYRQGEARWWPARTVAP